MHSHLFCSMYVVVSNISETQTESSSCVESAKCDDADDEGYVSLALKPLLLL